MKSATTTTGGRVQEKESVLRMPTETQQIHFTKDDAGRLPAGWRTARAGKDEGSIWRVVPDDTAPSGTGFVLAQIGASPEGVFNLCLAQDTLLQDLHFRLAFKAVQGKRHQGGGMAWRYADPLNYYIARMDPLGGNCRIYKVAGGKRTQLATGEKLRAAVGEWHRLRIEHEGKLIRCFFDDKPCLEVSDATFEHPGKIGLWTSADAQTYFDDLRVEG